MDYNLNGNDKLELILENQSMLLYAIGSFLTDCELEKAANRHVNRVMMKSVMLDHPSRYLGIKCLYQAAILGNPDAMYSLEMYKEAAELGHPDALYRCGRRLKDKAKRVEYLKRASELGSVEARKFLDKMMRESELR